MLFLPQGALLLVGNYCGTVLGFADISLSPAWLKDVLIKIWDPHLPRAETCVGEEACYEGLAASLVLCELTSPNKGWWG